MHLDTDRGYDLIGDVHGCAHSLEHLLDSLGYRLHAGVWRHPRRMALFLGDLIDVIAVGLQFQKEATVAAGYQWPLQT